MDNSNFSDLPPVVPLIPLSSSPRTRASAPSALQYDGDIVVNDMNVKECASTSTTSTLSSRASSSDEQEGRPLLKHRASGEMAAGVITRSHPAVLQETAASAGGDTRMTKAGRYPLCVVRPLPLLLAVLTVLIVFIVATSPTSISFDDVKGFHLTLDHVKDLHSRVHTMAKVRAQHRLPAPLPTCSIQRQD